MKLACDGVGDCVITNSPCFNSWPSVEVLHCVSCHTKLIGKYCFPSSYSHTSVVIAHAAITRTDTQGERIQYFWETCCTVFQNCTN